MLRVTRWGMGEFAVLKSVVVVADADMRGEKDWSSTHGDWWQGASARGQGCALR